jgi:hypothetical protein
MVAKGFMTEYGLGGECMAMLSETEVTGKTTRDVLVAVTTSPQRSLLAERTASTLSDVIKRGRTLDVEVVRHRTSDGNGKGTPIEMDEVLVRNKDDFALQPDPLTLRVSEHFKGG